MNKYIYDRDARRLSLRLASITSANMHPRVKSLYSNVFGKFGDKKFFEMPSVDNTSVIDACMERVKELPNINLLWSGGIDSTFVLACYKLTNTPIKVINLKNDDAYISPTLLEYVKNNFDLNIVEDTSTFDKVYTCGCSDCFFFSTQKMLGDTTPVGRILHGKWQTFTRYTQHPFISLEDRLRSALCNDSDFGNIGSRLFTNDEIDCVLKFADEWGKPIDTNDRIARFLIFPNSLARQAFATSVRTTENQESFFLTQKFINISYTQYWDSNIDPTQHDKQMFKDVIHEAFKSTLGVVSNV